jgi:hypothetical protein
VIHMVLPPPAYEANGGLPLPFCNSLMESVLCGTLVPVQQEMHGWRQRRAREVHNSSARSSDTTPKHISYYIPPAVAHVEPPRRCRPARIQPDPVAVN